MEAKNIALTYAIRVLIWLLEKAIVSINNGSAKKAKEKANSYDEDVKINKKTAKLFAKFVKAHVVEEKDDVEDGDE